MYFALVAFCLLCVLGGVVTETYWPAGIPLVIFVLYLAFTNFRPLFYLLLFFIPLSVEFYLPGGFGTDLPTEPLMIGLTGIFILHAARHWPSYRSDFYAHPVACLLYLHLTWLLLTTIMSDGLLVSIKFLLAKLWYVAAFFLIAGQLIRSPKDVSRMMWFIFWPLLFIAAQSFVRHALLDFSFADQYKTLSPFMRNHVAYAGILAAFAPWLVYLISTRKTRSWAKIAMVAVGFFWLVATYFSYTRAAYLSLILAAGAFFVVRFRLVKPVLALSLLVVVVGVSNLLKDNNYLEYAPNFETTVAHEEFDNLIAATYKLEDVSTMERAYRWVAGGNMIPYRPWFGWGPGNFVNFYKGYTVPSFRTYVSANPENSGVHSYYLMTLVEQGWLGLLILIAFLFGILVYAERAYHRATNPSARAVIMSAALSMVVIYSFLLINDMLETDKMGSLFFLNLAAILGMDGLKKEVGTSK